MKLQTKLLVLFTCRVVHTFRTSSLSVFRPKRDALASESVTLFSSSPSENSDPIEEDVTGVTLKIAFDSQGGVADLSSEKSERFTCGESLDMVHRLRRVSDAVLVGRSTVEIDDCTLTVRRVALQQNQRQPVRVIIDPKLDLKLDQFRIFRDGLATIIVHTIGATNSEEEDDDEKETCDATYVKSIQKDYPNVTLLGLKPVNDQGKERISTKHICEVLAKEFDIHHIMVEGGANTALQFLKDATVDRAIMVYAPILFKDPLLSNISSMILGEAGLEQIGIYELGVDSVKCFSRGEAQWPSKDISSWP